MASEAPAPRMCHVKKWEDFNGYGFNLHAEKGKPGHYIGALDAGSPAVYGGLRQGDRIVEVNGTNIANENHQQVVSRIRAVADEVKMLVADAATDAYYSEKKMVVRGDMPGVVHITTPATKAAAESATAVTPTVADPATPTDASEPQARLSKLRTWPDFGGYGFNLTTEKAKPGQYIGKVDADSPASSAGVCEGDRIIEVNGVNVTEENHHQVVDRIKAKPGQVDLLLVDKAAETFYASRGTVIRGDMPNILVRETPANSRDVPPTADPPAVPAEEAAVAAVAVAEAEQEAALAAVVVAAEEQAVVEPEATPVTQEEEAAAVAAVAAAVVIAEASEPAPDAQLQQATEQEAAEAVAVVAEATEAAADEADQTPLPSPMEAAATVAVVAAVADAPTVDSDAPRPRLCHVRKWATFQGYGFTLTAGGAKGHFIGSVDNHSPAEAAGLRKDDKIIEVNGSNVFEDDHKTVIGKVTSTPGEVQILVADDVTEAYYKDKKMKIHGTMNEIELNVCPAHAPSVAGNDEADEVAATTAAVAAVTIAAHSQPEPAGPSPRLCHLTTWPDFQGYGFNLNAEKGRVGNFIGAVDDGSPAAAAGMLPGDNIIQVNGYDVETASHGEVVQKIKSDTSQVNMLLADAATYAYYKERGVKISDVPNVKVIFCPPARPAGMAAAAPTVGVPRPRLHHLKKWPNLPGYGFDLHERLKQPGHLIGSVDPDSPAEATGLRIDDKIIEVNGKNMLDCTHHQVVDRIRQYSDRVSLLVVDPTTDRYYRDHSVWIHSKMANIDEIQCPSSNDKAPRPRLFHLSKWPNFQGYGFDLHEEKTRPGHLIGSVDAGSPSAAVGMRRDDKIVEVNGHNVLEESHKRVVERITEHTDTVKLLVVDSVAEQYYNDNSIWVHGRMDNIDVIKCPTENPATSGVALEEQQHNTSNSSIGEVVVVETVSQVHNTHLMNTKYAPRLCQLTVQPDYSGYGFDLQDEENRDGHFIGNVELNSPANRAGLREGDRVIQVNGEDVENVSHSDIVERIQQAGGNVKMLVIDDEAWLYFLNNNIKVNEDLVHDQHPLHVNGPSPVENGHTPQAKATTSGLSVSRLCHLHTTPDFEGFGFELHRLQQQAGHFIGAIDAGSPAERAGLHKGDEIVEVEGINVQHTDHNEVVQILRQHPQHVQLLVTNQLTPATTATTTTSAAATLRSSAPHARHCHIKQWPDFEGYGFDLYEIKKKPGPRVGAIAAGSPAEATGFKRDDYIIELNGKNVEKVRHPEMVKKIHGTSAIRMLLVDPDAYEYFRGRSVRLHSSMEGVENLYCPDTSSTVIPVTSGPRTVELQTMPNFSGFGFDLKELTNKSGHYVGSIDAGSPAAAAGLEPDDQVLEVNGESVVNASHDEVVSKIRQTPGRVSLMVVGAGTSFLQHSKALWVETGNRNTVIMVPTDRHDTVDATSATVISETAPRPRLCKVRRWPDFSGYGFDLHEEKNRPGHLIGNVDSGSPAEMAGLRHDDQIVEVNGHNVLESTHLEVVDFIKQHEDHVDILVLDNDAKDYYDDNSIWVHSKMSNIQIIECPQLPTQVISESAPRPRLCKLQRWADFSGYGFNLHEEKNRPGHIIGSVDSGSPADTAGLKNDDLLVEVNGHNVLESTHHQVVDFIKQHEDHVDLLVVDNDAKDYYEDNSITVHGNMSNVHVIECPRRSSQAAAIPIPVSSSSVEETTVAASGAEPTLRLCVLKKWPDYQGYGFNLHDEKGVAGHFIGSVDADSPADAAGLKAHDKIIEVNGETVFDDDHHQVVRRVTSRPDSVEILVMDETGDEYFRAHNIKPHGAMSNISVITCPEHRPQARVEEESAVTAVEEHHVTSTTAAVIVNGVADDESFPSGSLRLCTLKKWQDYSGYGFNLHDERGKPGHYIGGVETGSPAESAGLKTGYQLYEVNGVSVRNADHNLVIQHVLTEPDHVQMLIGDSETAQHYMDQGTWPNSQLAHVKTFVGSEHSPATALAAAASAAANNTMVEPEPLIRLCHLRKWTTYEGYGFRLHDDKNKPGHFIGPLEAGSPAELAGLHKGDRVIEVNGVSTEDMTHHGVVEKIVANPGEVRLLVLDPAADRHYAHSGVWPHGAMPNVSRIECPAVQPGAQANGVADTKHEANRRYAYSQLSPAMSGAYSPKVGSEATSNRHGLIHIEQNVRIYPSPTTHNSTSQPCNSPGRLTKSKTTEFVGHSRRRAHVRDTIPLERATHVPMGGGRKEIVPGSNTQSAEIRSSRNGPSLGAPRGGEGRRRPGRLVRRSQTDGDFRSLAAFKEYEQDSGYGDHEDPAVHRPHDDPRVHHDGRRTHVEAATTTGKKLPYQQQQSGAERDKKGLRRVDHSDRPHGVRKSSDVGTVSTSRTEGRVRRTGDDTDMLRQRRARLRSTQSAKHPHWRSEDQPESYYDRRRDFEDHYPSCRAPVPDSSADNPQRILENLYGRNPNSGRYVYSRGPLPTSFSLNSLPHSTQIIEEFRRTSSGYQKLRESLGRLNGYQGYHEHNYPPPGHEHRREDGMYDSSRTSSYHQRDAVDSNRNNQHPPTCSRQEDNYQRRNTQQENPGQWRGDPSPNCQTAFKVDGVKDENANTPVSHTRDYYSVSEEPAARYSSRRYHADKTAPSDRRPLKTRENTHKEVVTHISMRDEMLYIKRDAPFHTPSDTPSRYATDTGLARQTYDCVTADEQNNNYHSPRTAESRSAHQSLSANDNVCLERPPRRDADPHITGSSARGHEGGRYRSMEIDVAEQNGHAYVAVAEREPSPIAVRAPTPPTDELEQPPDAQPVRAPTPEVVAAPPPPPPVVESPRAPTPEPVREPSPSPPPPPPAEPEPQPEVNGVIERVVTTTVITSEMTNGSEMVTSSGSRTVVADDIRHDVHVTPTVVAATTSHQPDNVVMENIETSSSAHVWEHVVTASPPAMDVHASPTTYSRVEVVEVTPSQPQPTTIDTGISAAASAPLVSTVVVQDMHAVVPEASDVVAASTSSSSNMVLETVAHDDGLVVTTPAIFDNTTHQSTTLTTTTTTTTQQTADAPAVSLKSTTTADGTHVSIGPHVTVAERTASDTTVHVVDESKTPHLVETEKKTETERDAGEAATDAGIVLVDYRTSYVDPPPPPPPRVTTSQQMIPAEGHDSNVPMTEEIDTSGIEIVPPPPPLPEEMTLSQTQETEVVNVKSSETKEDIEGTLSASTVVTAATVTSIAADRRSVSSVATSEASSTAAAVYDFQEPTVNDEASEVAVVQVVNSHQNVQVVPVNGIAEVRGEEEVISTEDVSRVSTEDVHIDLQQPEVNSSVKTMVTTTTTEVVTVVTDNGYREEESTRLEVQTTPPPTEFTDNQKVADASRRSSASTVSDSATAYAFTAPELADTSDTIAVSDFMTSPSGAATIMEQTTVTSSHSYQVAEPVSHQNSQPAVSPADPLSGSLQEALNRARSRKKPRPGMGNNLSMKEKFDLFQQL